MSDIAVRVEHLSKLYRLGDQRARYSTFRETLVDAASAPLRWLKGERKVEPNTIWALDDVSFEIKHGEAVGIIGRNGAGKSTLLKILSRITRPTQGRVDLYGRVGSLLEVGTGFHPELTGRENIYLNGAILGMGRAEIQRKFDEIVDFAEVEKFLDTPVKFYSSGMYVRLAFAVAAHLEPEILVVDEVLAVGDAQFQKKCLGKMGDVAHEGRTVLFVSHNMTSITKLCESVIWIDQGQICMIDQTAQTIQAYFLSNILAEDGQIVFEHPDKDKEAEINSIELRNNFDAITSEFDINSPVIVDLIISCKRRILNFRVDAMVSQIDGMPIFSTTTQDYNSITTQFDIGTYRIRLEIPGKFLASGQYLLSVNICEVNIKNFDQYDSVLKFRIIGEPFRAGGNLGFLVYPFIWKTMPLI